MRHHTCIQLLVVLLAGFGSPAIAQRGDHPGEAQPDLPESLIIPEAPALSPAQELATFGIAEGGFAITLAAAEPMVIAPVSAVFDEDGRLWVVEMQSYMPDVDGHDELVPTSRVVILEDTNSDGTFDAATTFLDGLVLPRSVLPCYGGALVLAPPNLIFAKDTDGDGRADQTRVLLDGFGGLENPEHAGNGLLYGLDNWIHLSQHDIEIRFDGDTVVSRPTPRHGQWGITQDDAGRLYYCPNSDVLRMDVFAKHYASRNPNLRGIHGMNQRVMADTSVYPTRMNPGINRGYQKHMLRDDFTLARTTAACSPLLYRSAAWGRAFEGNAFTCEPAGNCVMRTLLESVGGIPGGRRAYPATEFLTSTDERFRPVALAVAPDGSLIVVDMYRGVIQHATYVTTFLRKQVEQRGLETPIETGRLWRIGPEAVSGRRAVTDGTASRLLPLSGRSNMELVELLSHQDAFFREHAQRLLVERRAAEIAPRLRELASSRSGEPRARIRALWTLEGIGALSPADASLAACDDDEQVAAHGVRLLERWADRAETVAQMRNAGVEGGRMLRVQVALSLGASRRAEATRGLAQMLLDDADDPLVRSAVLTGLHEREVVALAEIASLDRTVAPAEGVRSAIAELADASLRGSPAQRTRYLDLVAETLPRHRWLGRLLLERLAVSVKLDGEHPGTLRLAEEPYAWSALLRSGLWDLHSVASRITGQLRWPGHNAAGDGPAPLAGVVRDRYLLGRRLFDTCAACHGFDGRGMQGQAPPLAGSPIATGPEGRAVRVLLHGLQGPIEREGIVYDLQMPAAPFAADEEIAALLTYIRRGFGNTADPVTPETVSRLRVETADRATAWTEAELLETR